MDSLTFKVTWTGTFNFCPCRMPKKKNWCSSLWFSTCLDVEVFLCEQQWKEDHSKENRFLALGSPFRVLVSKVLISVCPRLLVPLFLETSREYRDCYFPGRISHKSWRLPTSQSYLGTSKLLIPRPLAMARDIYIGPFTREAQIFSTGSLIFTTRTVWFPNCQIMWRVSPPPPLRFV